MMFVTLRAASDDRVRQAFLLLQQIRRLDPRVDPTVEELARVEKGMLFVSLYACIEFTLTGAVSQFLTELQNAPGLPAAYHPALLTVLLNREFNAVVDASKRTIWKNKALLIERIFGRDACTIDPAVFPADGTNISSEHFESIWKHLQLPGPPLPQGVQTWLVDEIKNHRNAIAHGREKAANIGSRFSVATLESRFRAVQTICEHTILSFEDHLAKKSFLVRP